MPRSTSACSSASGRAHEPPRATATTPFTSAIRLASRAASCLDTRVPYTTPRGLTARVLPGTLRAVPVPERFAVGLVQMRCAPDPAANLDTALARTREAARAGARLVCLPELFRSQYFPQSEDH